MHIQWNMMEINMINQLNSCPVGVTLAEILSTETEDVSLEVQSWVVKHPRLNMDRQYQMPVCT